jgi:hypothetical protein
MPFEIQSMVFEEDTYLVLRPSRLSKHKRGRIVWRGYGYQLFSWLERLSFQEVSYSTLMTRRSILFSRYQLIAPLSKAKPAM